MSYKLMLVQSERDCNCYDACDCDLDITIQEVAFAEAAARYEFKRELVDLLSSLIEKKDDDIIQLLKNLGWANIQQVKDREEKLAMGKKFWHVRDGKFHSVQGFDIDNISDYQVRELAEEKTNIAQVVTKSSLKKLLSASQKKVYERESKRLKDIKDKKAAAAKKRKAAKAAKELEKARKLIEEAEDQT